MAIDIGPIECNMSDSEFAEYRRKMLAYQYYGLGLSFCDSDKPKFTYNFPGGAELFDKDFEIAVDCIKNNKELPKDVAKRLLDSKQSRLGITYDYENGKITPGE